VACGCVGTQVLGQMPLVYDPGCLSCNASSTSCSLPLMEVEIVLLGLKPMFLRNQ